ncbi:GNS1/SUR4 family-domain-containing protein [Lasiosphaeria miniovina]|uniref:Elongation of fatty acids protein n=1 Tax=Lasiosphaeria miniovina TaxID=1954250 RepID=A0AA40AVP3_9PEZI|nr:GNS1/SUR4 family-domain-containing protein [Lasiosphaeria miniovina]KAK0722895.1 GNS1/SUR4 family-domain-containing protein [Lasiosphaeria miniovina]
MGFESPAFLALPDKALWALPPNHLPAFITPPPAGSIPFAPLFDIPEHIYQAVLDPRVPLTIAAVYAVSAKLLNVYNKSTNKKPWAISKTAAFHWFVIAHNVFLAVYSAWTFYGMFYTLKRSLVSPLGPHGLSGFIDSVCRVNGPGGLGNAAFWDDESSSWQTFSADAVFDADGAPSRLSSGRMWNEGLAFYGWIFYLSKFYEVIDTLIILAKGKLSSTLQTYHHAGAMMCMWAGIRYMSAPIWVFVFVNSGIHAMMYTYYTITAFRIRVPMFIKRSLTSLQIMQFIFGASYGMVHPFVSYSIPVLFTSSQSNSASASASASVGTNASAAAMNGVKTPYSSHTMPCITSNSATFAVWLNVLYLAPLTYLFGSFFVESYLRRSNADIKAGKGAAARRLSNNVVIAEKAGWEAAKSVNREVYGESNEEAIETDTDHNAQPIARRSANGKAKAARTLRSRQ